MGHSYTSRGEAAPFEFELDGVGFVCGGGVSLLDLLEVTRMAQFDVDSPEGAAAIADLFKESMGKAEYARFRQHCREHNTEPDTIIEIMQDLVEHVTGGPTRRSRLSPPGPQTTTGTSRVDLPSVHELTPEEIQRWRAGVDRAAASAG